MKIYRCNTCGNIVIMLEDSGVVPVCCGKEMEMLKPGTTDGAIEKHVPVINRDGARVSVTVGEVPHPMNDEHHISWIILQTNKGFHAIRTYPCIASCVRKPEAVFYLAFDENLIAAYAYCNLHGLWIKEGGS